MSTLESAISMLEALPESDVQAVHDIIYRIYSRAESPLKPVTKEQILLDLALSREQVEEGVYKNAETAVRDIEIKYGI